MKGRKEIKAQAKANFMNNYWMSVGVSVVCVIIFSIVSTLSVFLGPIGTIAMFFVVPLTLGLLVYFVHVFRGEKPPFETMFIEGFKENYLRKVGGMAWMQLWVFLWSLLFVIPGIIKSLSYAMTPYILSFNPKVDAKKSLKLSMKIMDGHKADLFVFMLSFIGWQILSSFTFGLLTIFYVTPYYTASIGGFLDELFKDALEKGIITKADLNEDIVVVEDTCSATDTDNTTTDNMVLDNNIISDVSEKTEPENTKGEQTE